MNLTPREDFRLSIHARGWTDLCVSTQFENAAKTALLEVQRNLTIATNDREVAASNNFRLQGARLFLETLMSLTDTESTPKVTPTGLNYRT